MTTHIVDVDTMPEILVEAILSGQFDCPQCDATISAVLAEQCDNLAHEHWTASVRHEQTCPTIQVELQRIAGLARLN